MALSKDKKREIATIYNILYPGMREYNKEMIGTIAYRCNVRFEDVVEVLIRICEGERYD